MKRTPALREVRRALGSMIFYGDACRDDVAELCQKIDDVLPPEARQSQLVGMTDAEWEAMKPLRA